MEKALENLFQAIILGLLQGFTEWLPISSSGHLVVVQELMDMTIPVAFDASLHAGTLLAVVIFFRRDIKEIVRSLLAFNAKDQNVTLLFFILIGSIPTAVTGYLIKDFLRTLFSNTKAVGVCFLISGIFLLLSTQGNRKKSLNWVVALGIGVAQAIAIDQGMSRSGSTISTGLLCGTRRSEVFRYSFLLSIPAILGANMMECRSLLLSGLQYYSLIGLVISAVSGYIAIRIVHRALLSERFSLFSVYCFVIGVITLSLS
ncbi:undecaprenyl-diphosphate phosphatase [[Eubacterium] cellulosolvens]